jgi:hypothetical protein
MKTGRSLERLWLAELLGGFEMKQKGGFYEGAGGDLDFPVIFLSSQTKSTIEG